MAENVELDLRSNEWRVLLSTWYEGCFTDGHRWVVRQTASHVEPARFAVSYEALPEPLEDDDDDVDLEIGNLAAVEESGEGGASEYPVQLEERTVLIEGEQLRRILEQGAIPVPLVGYKEHGGLDGWRRGYSQSGFGAAVSLSWWCEGPGEWRPFTEWVERLQRFFHHELFPDESDVPPVMRP